MSSTYFLYLEAKVKEGNLPERWKCINGFYKTIPYGKTEEVLRLSHLTVNGSRTYFGNAYEKLSEIGTMTPFTELSKEVREEHPELEYVFDFNTGKRTDEIENYVTIPLQVFEATVPKGFSIHGVYHKDAIAAFENGEMEELLEDENARLKKMDQLEKQCYAYKEWDSPFGWEIRFKELAERIKNTKTQYMNDTWDFDEHEMRIVAFCL